MDSSHPSTDHLILVGMMGSGKTTVGRALAARLGRPFFDSDNQVELDSGKTVAEIWRESGEAAFRSLESEALREAVQSPVPAVIAAAGGVVLSAPNRAILAKGGTVVWLRVRPETSAVRVRSGSHRPLLDEHAEATLRRLEEERGRLYAEVADIVVDVDDFSVDQVVEQVLVRSRARR